MKQARLLVGVFVADLAWSLVAMGIAFVLRYGIEWSPVARDSAWHLLPFLVASWLIWALFSILLPLDGFRGGWRLSAVVSHLLLAVSGLMLILLAGGYLFRSYVSRLALAQFGVLLFAGYICLRVSLCHILLARVKKGEVRRVVILGSGPLARELARKIERHPEMLCSVIGFLAPDDRSSDSMSSLPVREGVQSTGALGVVEILSKQRADEVIFVLQECASPELLNLAALCRDRGVKVSLVPQFYDLYLSRSHLTDLGGLPIIELGRPGLAVPALVGKRILDLTLGSLLFVASLPILLPLAIRLRITKGKAFRWETRCGLHGKQFPMLRLNVDRKGSQDSPFENILSELSLTELPQLWNVLKGDMSLVGPRPEALDRVCRYSEWQQQRLTVKPGITGLAQVQGLREQNSSEEKTRFDLQYLLHVSLWTDLSLLLQTIWTLATRSTRRDHSQDTRVTGTASEVVRPHVTQDILEDANRP